ncbi:hypothetical protein ACHAWF_007287 [Thalassiosira exigua]
MAKSKRFRGAPTRGSNTTGIISGVAASNNSCGARESAISLEAIESHWVAFPPGAKSVILNLRRTFAHELIQFWCKPQNIYCTRSSIARGICGASWYLAFAYIRLGRLNAAQALTLNGSFIHQCFKTSIEEAVDVLNTGIYADIEKMLPHFARGIRAVRSNEAMANYVRQNLPEDFSLMMTKYANLSTSASRISISDHISDDWKGNPSRNSRSSSLGPGDGKQIKIAIIDDANNEDQHCFDIGLSTTLKALFNDYANKRGVSLRSLRFSYAGKPLFLSNAGNETPGELGMDNLGVIKVCDMSRTHELRDEKVSSQSLTVALSSPKNKKSKNLSKKTRGKNTKPHPHHREGTTMTERDFKFQHFQQLTKVHEEAQPRANLKDDNDHAP